MRCLTPSNSFGLIVVTLQLGIFIVAFRQQPLPDAQLRSYLEHCHKAQMDLATEGVAFAKVFNGQERRFAGYAEKVYSSEQWDQLIVTLPDCDFWFYLYTLPNEFPHSTVFDPKLRWIEFDCKIKEFNVGYSLGFYTTNFSRHFP